MTKRLTALGLAILLVLSLFGCASETKEKDAIQEFMNQKNSNNEMFVAFGKDADDMKDPLVICIDVEYAREPLNRVDTVLNEFLMSLEQTGGLSEVQILYVPKHGADRETKLDRLRVEIMSGAGPDVFIMNCAKGYYETTHGQSDDSLIKFPEMAMENGLFLPLDDYMENNTRFTEWDKLTQPVLAAGRNWEGQQIIPVAYTMPLLFYKKADVDLDLTDAYYTWEDMLTNPEIAPYAARFADCSESHFEFGMEKPTVTVRGNYFPYILGQLADFKEEELCFTEEELLEYVRFVLDHAEAIDPASDPPLSYSEMLGSEMDWEFPSTLDGNADAGMTMIPMYTADGGVSAMITSWAAVNRNTKHPEEAYTVIDMLLSMNMQKNNWIYSCFIFSGAGIPMHEDLLQPDKEFSRFGWTMTEINYNELCEVRSQITEAHFQNELTAELSFLLNNCYFGIRGINGGPMYGDFSTVEEAVHEAYEKMQRMVRE